MLKGSIAVNGIDAFAILPQTTTAVSQ